MAKFNFNLRDASASSPTPIYLVVRWDNQVLKLSTQETINPIYWNADKQKAVETKKFPQYPEFNRRLSQILTYTEDLFRTIVNANKRQPSKSEFKSKYDEAFAPKKNMDKDLINYIEKYIETAKVRHGVKTHKPISKYTIKLLTQFKTLFEEYSKHKKKRFEFDDITMDFYYDFLKYMNEVKVYATNTSGRRIKDLKIILKDAVKKGVSNNLIYQQEEFMILTEDTDSIYLNEEELNLIYNLDLSMSPKLDRVRDLFLVGCWTGLRFSDFTRINKNNIKKDKIEITTQKTNTKIIIPIFKIVRAILFKYNGDLPRAISNQKMNEYLKDICKLIPELNVPSEKSLTKGGLKVVENKLKYELVQCHTARRSFATNMYLDNLQIYHIMGITGHQTEKQFLRYIKMTNDESANVIELHWENKYKKSKTSS
jgi:integrase